MGKDGEGKGRRVGVMLGVTMGVNMMGVMCNVCRYKRVWERGHVYVRPVCQQARWLRVYLWWRTSTHPYWHRMRGSLQLFLLYTLLHRVPKLAMALASNTHNSVFDSWISTKYRTLHCHTIVRRHAYYDRALSCVLSVTSLWGHSLFAVGLRCYRQSDQAPEKPKVTTLSTNFKTCSEWLFS